MAVADVNEVDALIAEAKKQVAEEGMKKAREGLVVLYRKLEAARQVVRNIEAEVDDAEAAIRDGSFRG